MRAKEEFATARCKFLVGSIHRIQLPTNLFHPKDFSAILLLFILLVFYSI